LPDKSPDPHRPARKVDVRAMAAIRQQRDRYVDPTL
jgi:hypothetical protein